MTKAELRDLVHGLIDDDLRTLRAIINGKLGKRKINAEQQAKMQAARKCIKISDSCCSCETDKMCRACIVKEEIRKAFDCKS